MKVSKRAVDFIISEEISSQALYNQKYTGIVWPGGESGATIGIGYDLGYVTPTDIEKDWIKDIGITQVNILKMFSGLRGPKAKTAIAGNSMAKQVSISYQAAYNVFTRVSLPRYAKQALRIYPGLDQLTPDAAGAIVSMVYNRYEPRRRPPGGNAKHCASGGRQGLCRDCRPDRKEQKALDKRIGCPPGERGGHGPGKPETVFQ